ncbi:fungal chitosanase of glycosyl hydrolase group 75-domain-containing protein [Mycena alexandri]|uniref:Endo-chitosanase n=1 Tax=Mycena alexandri TaxID=1745969 RepID=A0AAD6SWW4_9AGAR|nr:fungal chitosanase of glycosyl hydrolase group 75-domain-containing protein [Mycena alexandri]
MKFASCMRLLSTAVAVHLAFALPATRKGTVPTKTGTKPPVPSAVDAIGAAFAADPSINVAGIYAAAQASNSHTLATYPTTPERKAYTNIYADWNFTGVSAFHFIADMDVDCDGPKSNCKGNRDGQSETSFGALDATKVPYFVLPERFTQEYKSILKDNALGAIICNGKMFYGIYGDQDADSPQVIGEASILIGQTCFPGGTINGDNGHPENDVAYIVFGSQVPVGVQKNSIDLPALKALGDAQVKLLQKALHL